MTTNQWNLSEREVEIAELFIEIGCAKKIAAKLGITIRTVDFHAKRIRQKMQASTNIQAMVLYDREMRDKVIPVQFPKVEKMESAWPAVKPVNSVFALGAA